MNFKSLYIILLMALAFSNMAANAQSIVEREVISSAGGEGNSASLNVSYTIGETVIETGGTSVSVTQGFEQENFSGLISFDLSKQDVSCPDKTNGFAEVSNINGCVAPYTVLFSAGNAASAQNRTTNLGVGQYTLQITSADGCSSPVVTFSIESLSDEPCLLKFYSGFTPNNDGINDQWIIDNVDVFPSNEIAIFNRLGNKVWEGSNYDNVTTVWSGENMSGGDSPSDTYFYVFESEGEIEKGWIELTR